ncbi:M10 family metallopeptidase C-terminal domain-containing protein [Pseudomonas sp. FP1911]|uniref:M10 family metallopeptidase C-terminal domain-containing protein n=2 Tax=Pseudomonas TaxID=286 RepID=UPI000853AA55|nr:MULTISPECIES: M10 family metallopeptidase C-terminal domain-containing protein [unclassified Pseudomonas]AOS73172.1 alkaline protease [Pseudomonas fluorescens]WLG81233.1 M10 family metallopeptidase C-terminal domain-containing protein [Pseudomonas sp. FP1911]SDS85378.1 type I secretion C-terminal target domain (VC_A0849 subclass) [Pseudomonas sp. bs2935]
MINANTPAANYYVPTPNAAPQPSQVLRSGNPAESEAASFLHRDANLAADKQASTNSQLLNLSAPLIGARTHQQRMYGLSLNSGLLRLGDIHSGNVVTARCYPMAEENTKPTPEPRPNGGTKPAADQPQPNGGTKGATDQSQPNGVTKPAADQPRPNGGTKPAADQPQPNGGTKGATDQSQPNGGTKPAADQPRPNGGTKPIADQPRPSGYTTPVSDRPKPNIDTTPVGGKPKPSVDTLPVVDKPKPSVDTLPVVDKPKPNVDTLPVVDKPKPNVGTLPVVDKSKPNVDTMSVVDKPKPNVDTLPVVDKAKPNVGTLPVVDKPKPNVGTLPVVDKPKPNIDTMSVVDKPKPNVDTLPVVDKPKLNVDTLPVVDKPKQPRDTRTDDTTYGFNSNTGKAETTLTSAADKPDFNVWDERGNDTFDFSGFKQDQIINLRGGSFSSVGGLKENVRIGEKTVIENAVGGHGNDRIIGNSADNVLTGGAGADTLVGGGGWNTFKFNAFSDSTRANADLLLDFNTGQDKIDLSQMVLDGKVALNFVENYTGAAGDTIIKFNPQTGRYLLAVDLDGDGKTDFLIKSTRMISPEDVIGLNIKEGSYL